MNRLVLIAISSVFLFSHSADANKIDKSARLRMGTISIQVSKMTVSSAPFDTSLTIPFLEYDAKMDGQRVYPQIEGSLALVNSSNSSSSQITIRRTDGVLGDLNLGGLYLLHRKANVLYARFIADVVKQIDHALEIGTVSETGEVKLNEGLRFVAKIVQYEAPSLQRWTGTDWDHERVQVYIDGIGKMHRQLYGDRTAATPGNIELKR